MQPASPGPGPEIQLEQAFSFPGPPSGQSWHSHALVGPCFPQLELAGYPPLWRFLVDHMISGIRGEFERYHSVAEGALTQMGDDAFFHAPDADANSAAILVKHMAGNLRSRWTDFLTTDGEKPDRDRDSEFELTAEDTREKLMTRWSAGWQLVFDELGRLNDMDLGREVYIRGQPLSVSAALVRQLAHAVYHVGQIVTLARQQAGSWQSLSVPRGGSEAFNERMRKG